MLRANDLPTKVIDECEIRTRLYHANGHSGPLGTLALIDILRFTKVQLPSAEKPPVVFDWRGVPRHTRVTAYCDGALRKGEFMGYGPNATLAILIDSEEMTRHIRACDVRILDQRRERELEAESADAQLSGDNVDWKKATAGVAVWVSEDGDVKAGVVSAPAKDAHGPSVMVDGEDKARRISPDLLTLDEPLPS